MRLSANAIGQLVALATMAACAVISFVHGWYITGLILLIALVALVI